MKQYLLSVHYIEGQPPLARDVMAKIYKEVNALNDELRATGTWVFGGGLHTPDVATVVRAQDGEVLTTDGPFAESKEHIGGFWVIKGPRFGCGFGVGGQGLGGVRRAGRGAPVPRGSGGLTQAPNAGAIERIFREEYGA